MAAIKARGLRKVYKNTVALDGIDLDVAEGCILGLIGPNGAGKTTAFNLITGVFKPTAGTITFRGTRVDGNTPDRNAALGMSRTFQNIRLFRDLPLIDNVMVGLHMRHGTGFWPTVLRLPVARRSEAEIRKRAFEKLEMLGLAARAERIVGSLPYGDQRKVEFARALATEPSLLLLDEPTAGMNPQETADLGRTIQRLHRELKITTLLVEHDMKMVMGICERLIVVNQGRVLATGAPAEIKADPSVIEAYLGRRRKDGHAAA